MAAVEEFSRKRPELAVPPACIRPAPARKTYWLERVFRDLGLRGAILTPDGEEIRASAAPPLFRVTFHDWKLLGRPAGEFALAQAYVKGAIDIDGDMLALLDVRDRLSDRLRLGPWLRFAAELFRAAPTRHNRELIEYHYGLGDDFYLPFLDSRYRIYSQCIFPTGTETLEEAAGHKLEGVFRGLALSPGMRVLEIGAGWGGVIQYFCPRGVDVTAITLTQGSLDYVGALIRANHYSARVSIEDFMGYRAVEPYDAVVMCGLEHFPYYRQFFARAWECLKPGGRIYVDGSAAKEKFSISQFTRHYTWPGTHSFMCLQDAIQEALWHGFQIVEVKEESHDYALTMREWAERFDRNREKIVGKWGEELFRAFRVYLWGGCHALRHDRLQAYHVVARRGPDRGPRPGLARRIYSSLRQLA